MAEYFQVTLLWLTELPWIPAHIHGVIITTQPPYISWSTQDWSKTALTKICCCHAYLIAISKATLLGVERARLCFSLSIVRSYQNLPNHCPSHLRLTRSCPHSGNAMLHLGTNLRLQPHTSDPAVDASASLPPSTLFSKPCENSEVALAISPSPLPCPTAKLLEKRNHLILMDQVAIGLKGSCQRHISLVYQDGCRLQGHHARLLVVRRYTYTKPRYVLLYVLHAAWGGKHLDFAHRTGLHHMLVTGRLH